MSAPTQIGVVILAAGASRRLGRPKQLLPFRGRPLLQGVIDLLEPLVLTTRILVLGAHADAIRAAVAPAGWQVIINEKWQEGIAGSIRRGIREAMQSAPETEHLLFLLSDQPFLDRETVTLLIQTHLDSGRPATACTYRGDIGVPAIFGREMFPDLLALQGDRGAGKILRERKNDLATIPFDRGYFDVDTPEAYEQLLRYE